MMIGMNMEMKIGFRINMKDESVMMHSIKHGSVQLQLVKLRVIQIDMFYKITKISQYKQWMHDHCTRKVYRDR